LRAGGEAARRQPDENDHRPDDLEKIHDETFYHRPGRIDL
jgi:hypothetical protein